MSTLPAAEKKVTIEDETLTIEANRVEDFLNLLTVLSTRGAYILNELKVISELSETLKEALQKRETASLEKHQALTLYNVFALSAARGKFTVMSEYENLVLLFNLVRPFAEKYGRLTTLHV